MLLLTRLNGHPMAINGDLIKSVESSPDTMIALVTGEKIVVRESMEQVIEIAHAWRVQLLRQALCEDNTRAEQAEHAAACDSAAGAAIAHHAQAPATDRPQK
jgi:flagellar protein FlbD